MSDFFQNQHLAAIVDSQSIPLLAELNKDGKERFSAWDFPSKKHESWKYTSLYALTQKSYANKPQPKTISANELKNRLPDLSGSLTLVIVDGVLDTSLSDSDALRLITPFSMASAEQQQTISSHLGKTEAAKKNDNLLLALNDAACVDGALVHVDRNQRLETLLNVVYVSSEQKEDTSHHTRLLIVLDDGAEAKVAEYFISIDEQDNALSTAVSDIFIGKNAALTHYKINTQQEDALFFGGCFIDLQRDARYHGFHLALGSAVNRHDIRIEHLAGGSHCDVNGVYVPQNKQLVDFHTSIEHAVPHCTSDEIFRGIMNDKAKAVFNGRIHIHRDAQKTFAEMSNKNLLLTNTAEINTKPELEIYADDVRCAHGATVAQLDSKSLFYLMSRGISKAEAEVMLSFGFINELIDALSEDAIREWLRPILAYRFGREQALAQHLVVTP